MAEAAATRTRSFALPGLLAGVLFAAIVFIHFSGVLGQLYYPAEFLPAVGFYYCWAWHCRLSKKADSLSADPR